MNDQETNISDITDVRELKAMAYDQIALAEKVNRNLQLINQRIAQLVQPEIDITEVKKNVLRNEGGKNSTTV